MGEKNRGKRCCFSGLFLYLVWISAIMGWKADIFHISAAALASAGEAMTAAGISFTAITRDTNIIAEVVAGNSGVLGCFTAQQIATITEFSQHMNFFGIDLTRIPKLGLSLDIVLPLLSVITMFLSTHISMKASGQQMQGSMKLTMYMMPLMYLFFCFTYPLAFSLYYVISNIVMTAQTQVMRKFYDPEKMRKESCPWHYSFLLQT